MSTTPIDLDVRRIATRWAGSSTAFPRLIWAVVQAEGGKDHILAAVRCSVPSCKDTNEAIEILCRSAAHAMADYLCNLDASGFVEKWGATWAPVGVENDPKGLNRNWTRNVLSIWLGK